MQRIIDISYEHRASHIGSSITTYPILESIYNLIRGLSPYPTAFTTYLDKNNQPVSIKLFSSEIENCSHHLKNGEIETDSKTYLKVACSNGFIHIKELQMAGKKRMTVEEFLRGFKVYPEFNFCS